MANFLDKTGLQEYDRLVKEHIANKFSQYVDLSSAQTITGNKTTTGTFKVQNGDAKGSFVVGADVNAKTLTANTRKLGRMGVPAYTSNGSTVTSTVAGISFDAQANANYADFGGHPNNTSSIAPDVIRFVVANQHNNTINGARTLALQISKQDGLVDTSGGGTSVASAKFFVPVQVTSTVTASGGFVGDLTGKASDSDKLDGNDSAYFLDYDHFINTPTIPSKASDVGADPSGSANTALTNAKSYTDTQIANLINGAPDTLNTLGEIATAMSENAGVVTALQSAIGDKANKTDIPTDYISTGSTAQCRTGGLVLGVSSIPSGVNATAGRVYVIGSNPLFGLKATAEGSTQFFLQAQKDKLYLGPTSSNALEFGSTGATTVPSTFTAKGLITANNGLKTSKIQAPTTSGGSTYGVGSDGQVLISNGSTNYWGQVSYDNLSNKPTIPTVPTNVSSFENDAGYLTSISKSDIGLENVENKSSATIRSEITKSNVTTALGYTPPTQDTTYSEATTTTNGLMSASDKTKLGVTNVAYATCTTPAATAAKVVTISGNDNWELTTGSIIVIKFSATNTASNPTLNVNGTGAKPIVYLTSTITTSNKYYAGYKDRCIEYIYDGSAFVFIGWSYDANTSYSNATLGQGYSTCSTAETTLEKTVTMSSYALTKGGITVVKFTNAVPANSTLNINSAGAKNIYWKGSAITNGVIKAGDTASFIYDGTQYQCFSIDRDEVGSGGGLDLGDASIEWDDEQQQLMIKINESNNTGITLEDGDISLSADTRINVGAPRVNITTSDEDIFLAGPGKLGSISISDDITMQTEDLSTGNKTSISLDDGSVTTTADDTVSIYGDKVLLSASNSENSNIEIVAGTDDDTYFYINKDGMDVQANHGTVDFFARDGIKFFSSNEENVEAGDVAKLTLENGIIDINSAEVILRGEGGARLTSNNYVEMSVGENDDVSAYFSINGVQFNSLGGDIEFRHHNPDDGELDSEIKLSDGYTVISSTDSITIERGGMNGVYLNSDSVDIYDENSDTGNIAKATFTDGNVSISADNDFLISANNSIEFAQSGRNYISLTSNNTTIYQENVESGHTARISLENGSITVNSEGDDSGLFVNTSATFSGNVDFSNATVTGLPESGGGSGGGSVDTNDLQVEKLSILDPGGSVSGYFTYSNYGGISSESYLFSNIYIPTVSANDVNGQVSPYSTVYARGGIVLSTNYSDTNRDGNTKLLFPTDIVEDQTFATREWVQAQGYGSGGSSGSGGSIDTTNFKVDKLTLTYLNSDQGYIAPNINYSGIEFSRQAFAPKFVPSSDISSTGGRAGYSTTQYLKGGILVDTPYSNNNPDGTTKLKFPTDRVEDQTLATREWVLTILEEKGLI